MDLEKYSAEDRLADLEKEREELREQVFKDAPVSYTHLRAHET